jgi:predicted dehydrogenase
MSQTPVKLLILGTGGMARAHAEAFGAISGVELVGGVDTDAARLGAFNAVHGIARGFASLDDAIGWGEFDAVANVTPDGVHYATTMALLAARKHVFCEKPLATNHAHADEMAQSARNAGVVNMVNLTYRNVAALKTAAEMVGAGDIGAIRHFDASYLQSWLTQPAWGDWRTDTQWLWRLSSAHGSNGTLGDTGIHILDFATYIAGCDVADVSARLVTFDKAEGGQIGEYVLNANDSMAMHVSLTNKAVGVISTICGYKFSAHWAGWTFSLRVAPAVCAPRSVTTCWRVSGAMLPRQRFRPTIRNSSPRSVQGGAVRLISPAPLRCKRCWIWRRGQVRTADAFWPFRCCDDATGDMSLLTVAWKPIDC